MKVFLTVIIFLLISNLFAELTVIVEVNRFLDADQNTIYNIDYEIPYKDIKFIKTDYGFGAQVDVKLMITSGNKSREKSFANNIVLSDFFQTLSDDSFKDRISLTLKKSGPKIMINFIDILAEQSKEWKYDFVNLEKNALISDLEFSSEVIKDTTLYLHKFHRDDQLFIVSCSHIFSNELHPFLNIYYELYDFADKAEKFYDEKIIISRNAEIVKKYSQKQTLDGKITSVHRQLDISELEAGFYDVEIEIDNGLSKQNIREYFSLKNKKAAASTRFFTDKQKDIEFIEYFLNSAEKKQFKSLKNETKFNYLDRFWKMKDPQPQSSENEIIDILRKRLEYVNDKFSYHKKEGWETDRGRIYLKYGEPDEIIKLNTNMYQTDANNEKPQGIYTAYGSQDFHIWKYRSSLYETYIFLDSFGNKGFKLIYAGGDDTEITRSNWKYYLGGENFDMNLLN